MDDQRIAKKYNKIVELNGQINYNMFVSDKSYQELVNGYKLDRGHPLHDGHQHIAEIMYEAVKNKG